MLSPALRPQFCLGGMTPSPTSILPPTTDTVQEATLRLQVGPAVSGNS